jgi:ATP/maltotriose-dependent transcriptional regulator MalT
MGRESGWRLNLSTELADAHRLVGDLSGAERLLDETEALAVTIPDENKREFLFNAPLLRARLELARGRPERAVLLAERALDKLAELHHVMDPHITASAKLTLARALKNARGDLSRARMLAEEARDAFSKVNDVRRAQDATTLLAALPL